MDRAENYAALASDPIFRKSLACRLVYGLVSVPATLVLALVLAIMLNAKIPALGFFRSAYYLPSVISGVAVAMLWKWLFNGEYGLINVALGKIGIARARLADRRELGAAGADLHEPVGLRRHDADLPRRAAGRAEGALRGSPGRRRDPLRQHLHVTVPMLSSVTLFNLIMGVINALQVFAEPFVLTPNGGPNNSTLLLSVYLYQNAFQYLKMGYASAIAWVTFAIILALTPLVFRSMPHLGPHRGGDER